MAESGVDRQPVWKQPFPGKILERGIEHERGALRKFLSACDPGSSVAVETNGNWYWIVDEIEAAGINPQPAYTDFRRHVYLNDPDAEQGNDATEETIV